MPATTTSLPDGVFGFRAIGASETTETQRLGRGGAIGAVQAFSGGGTGFNSGSVSVEGSLDKINWFQLKDTQGAAIVFTVAGYAEISTAVPYVRVVSSAGVNDVDLFFRFVAP